MTVTVNVQDEEIIQMAKEIVAKRIADDMLEEWHSPSIGYRRIIKEVVREVIKADKENLSDRAVKAAAKSIENLAVKSMEIDVIKKILNGDRSCTDSM